MTMRNMAVAFALGLALAFSLEAPAQARKAAVPSPQAEDLALKAEDPSLQAETPFMRLAIAEALAGIRQGHGGPFGSVVVKDGKVVAKGHNKVLQMHDPTMHGEIDAIRGACRALGTHDLSGCEIYTTGEPCPMCLAACLWANISKIHYGCTIADNTRIGFRDETMDKQLGGRKGLRGYLIPVDRKACLSLFDAYLKLNPRRY